LPHAAGDDELPPGPGEKVISAKSSLRRPFSKIKPQG
jgi:hypothetical protein